MIGLQEQLKLAINSVTSGAVNDDLAEVFFPGGAPIARECVLWDYKQTVEDNKLGFAELAKDALSFFNSYGGYIFLGVAEQQKDEKFVVCGFQRPGDFIATLRSTIDSYSSVRFEVLVHDLRVIGHSVTAIYVPARRSSQQPAFLTRNGPEKKPGAPIFLEKTTYFRCLDRVQPARIASDWEFLNSARDPNELLIGEVQLTPASILSRVIPNNLPDRNLICPHLYGREDVLAALWAWLPDELEPVRLLAGAGGKGKTSIAYEFASRFFRNAPLPFNQVLWVSAKRFQFRADRNEYVELPECWYSNPLELLQALCIGTAALTAAELAREEDSEYTLRRKLRESLSILPSFIVIDDVDSLEPTQQRRVFELVQQVSAGAPSKFLLTTRANYAFSEAQCIQVSGLEGEPYRSLVSDRLSRFGLGPLKSSEIDSLQKASGGSPLWTDSILRLMKQGYSFRHAVAEWKGRPGEDARAAALRKELEALSASAKRILLAAAVLRDCSRTELLEITKIGKTELDDAILELQTLFLVDAPKIIRDEPRFSVPESTAIAVTEAASELVPDHKGLLQATREFTKRALSDGGTGAKKKVGTVVNQAIALLSRGEHERAIKTVDAALRAAPSNADLLMLKGRCLRETNPAQAARVLGEAFKNGQRKPLLFDMWYQSLLSDAQYAAAFDVANLAIDNGQERSTWLPLRARTLVQIGILRNREGDIASAIDMLLRAASDLRGAIACSRDPRRNENHRADIHAVHDAAWKVAEAGTGLDVALLTFDAVRKMIESGDLRIINADRVVQITVKLVSGVDLSSEKAQARAARTRLADAIRVLREARSNNALLPAARPSYEGAIGMLESLPLQVA